MFPGARIVQPNNSCDSDTQNKPYFLTRVNDFLPLILDLKCPNLHVFLSESPIRCVLGSVNQS